MGWLATPKRPKKKKKKFWVLESGHTTTPKGLGWLQLPHTAGIGLAEATPRPLVFFFGGWPLAIRVVQPPLDQKWGGSTTPRPKMGWSSHPILAKGWLQPPRLLLFFFF
jgi:hypothetical protein